MARRPSFELSAYRSDGDFGFNLRVADLGVLVCPPSRRKVISQDVSTALIASGHEARVGTTPKPIERREGILLALLFAAVVPLRSAQRSRLVREGILTMSETERSYWHRQMVEQGDRAAQALRLLLAAP